MCKFHGGWSVQPLKSTVMNSEKMKAKVEEIYVLTDNWREDG